MNEIIKINLSNSNASNTQSMLSRLQGSENKQLTQKQSQKQQLQKQITFLKEKVKRLKIDKLNQKILLSDERQGKVNQIYQGQEDGNIFKVERYDDQSPRYVGSRIVTNSNNNQQQKQQSPENPYININYQAKLSKELSPHQQSHPPSLTSTIVNFRVGRIVKNSQRYSLQKPINNFSKTLEIHSDKNTPTSNQIIKQCNQPAIEQFNHSIHTRNDISRKSNSVNHRNSQIHSEQCFRTLQSRSKLSNTSQQQPFHSRYQQRQKLSISQKINGDIINTQLFHNKNSHVNTTKNISLILQPRKSKPITTKKISHHLDFDQTVISADITIRNHADVEYFQQQNLQTQKNIKQSDVKTRKQFVKSNNNFNNNYNNNSNTNTIYNSSNTRNAYINSITPLLSNNPSRTQTRKNSRVSLILTNPQYHQQQIGETIKQKNISIKKVSYKIKNKKNPNDLRKAQLLNNFLQLESGKKGIGSRVNRAENERSDGFVEGEENQKRSSGVRKDGMNVNFQKRKEDIINKRSQKVRLLQKSKQKNVSIEAEKFRQLKGKIIKNFATIQIPHQQSSQEQDEFAPDLLPTNAFSTTQIPFIGDKPDSKSNQQQIIQMTLRACKKLNILSIKRDMLQNIIIKKFRNCLIFTIPKINKKVIWYYEGKLYIGECSSSPQLQCINQGHKSGQGIQIISQKSYYYKGQFLNNKKHGSGIYINLIKNQIFQGQFLNGEKHGIGKLLNKNNQALYEGQFKQNKYDGFGILKLSKQNDRDQVYKGTFLRGLKHGYGIEVFKNGDKYKGQYQNEKFNGKGKYTWQNGNVYEGTFSKGMRTGQGKWMSSKQNGDLYVGMYLNDKKNGLGRYCWNNGSIFQGHFENDQKHGQGILTYQNGKVVEGRWQHNKLVEIKNQSKQQRQKRQSEQQQTTIHQIYKSQDCQRVRLIDRPQKTFIQSSKLLKNG